MQKKNGRVHLRREEGAMGDQCGVPVAASTRREKAREADVVGYCPFANVGSSVLVCIIKSARAKPLAAIIYMIPAGSGF